MELYEPKALVIKDWAVEDRPREKLLQKGRSALTDAELLGILIGTGIKNMTAVDLAMQILRSVNNDLAKLARLNVKDLAKFKGIGEAKAINIVAALELGRRRKDMSEDNQSQKLVSSKLIYEYLEPIFADLNHEEFWILMLNRQLKCLKAEKISSGGVSGTYVDPKIIFKTALDHLATAIVLCHNHPSGAKKPSQEDEKITKKLVEAGKILDISVLDHIIYTDNGYFSFADEGLLN